MKPNAYSFVSVENFELRQNRPLPPQVGREGEIATAVWFTRLDTPKPDRYHFRFRSQREPTPMVICLSRSRIN